MALMFNNASHNLVSASLDALWMQQQVVSNNIANYETPDYKAQTVNFEQVLKAATETGGKEYDVSASIEQRADGIIRSDGNNVDMEQEQLELWRAYTQYSYLIDKISGDFSKTRYVINQLGK